MHFVQRYGGDFGFAARFHRPNAAQNGIARSLTGVFEMHLAAVTRSGAPLVVEIEPRVLYVKI